jgi:DNA-binding protein H-NS
MGTIFSRNESMDLGCPMKLRLDDMSADELWGLHEEIGKILSTRITSEKRELERRLAQLKQDYPITDSSHSVDSTLRAPRREYPAVLPKYRNPEAPHETWAGRGRQPRWMVAALKAGRKMEDFLIIGKPTDKRNNRSRQKSR